MGRANCGKTTFYTNFLRSLGYRDPKGEACPITLRWKRSVKACELVDTVSLVDGILPDAAARAGMARTLMLLASAYVVIHVVSAPLGAKGFRETTGAIDLLVSRYARRRKKYLLLANKCDLPGARTGIQELRAELGDQTIIPISATLQTGFHQVQEYLFNLL